MQSNYARQKYDLIKSLDDLVSLISDSKDGESSWLEFKAIKKQGLEKEKEFLRHQKSLLAKEICAFLNTSDGIIAWGIEYSETNGIKISNDYNGNLYELLDLCIQTIVEPTPSGIDFKIIEEDNKNALLIFIPKSNIMPHRVWGEADSSYKRNYYVRSGTNSVSLNESTVRALYRSDGYIPRISIFTEPRIVSNDCLSLDIFADPDSTHYVDRYYDKEEFMLLDGSGNTISIKEDMNQWNELIKMGPQSKYAIYPSINPVLLFDRKVKIVTPRENGSFMGGVINYGAEILDGDIDLIENDFNKIKFIVTRSSFACDKVSLTIDKRLYILNTPPYIKIQIDAGRKNFCFSRKKVFEKIEKDYNIKIYILNTYEDEDIKDDYDYSGIDPCTNGKITISFLRHIFNRIKDL